MSATIPDATLAYEPSDDARPVMVERQGDVTRIVVAMRGLYAPVPTWVGAFDILAFVIIPVWCIASLLIRTMFRIPKPPRAIFEIDALRFKAMLRNRDFGALITVDVPRASVVAARANRFEPGLWIDIPGRMKNSCLTELPRSTIDKIDAALRDALAV